MISAAKVSMLTSTASSALSMMLCSSADECYLKTDVRLIRYLKTDVRPIHAVLRRKTGLFVKVEPLLALHI